MIHLENIYMVPCSPAFSCLWPMESPGSLREESEVRVFLSLVPSLQSLLEQSAWCSFQATLLYLMPPFQVKLSLFILNVGLWFWYTWSVNENFGKTFLKLSYFRRACVSLLVPDWQSNTLLFSDFSQLQFLSTKFHLFSISSISNF